MTRRFAITAATSPADLATAALLFEAYAASLGIDLGYQDFAAEVSSLPGSYCPPAGALLLARDESDRAIGCVALRPLAIEDCCEMKRLYVAPDGRGHGLGKALVRAIIAEARRIGYPEMRLDTLRDMTSAQALYRDAGFVPIAAYYDTPVAGTVFMRLMLGAPSDR